MRAISGVMVVVEGARCGFEREVVGVWFFLLSLLFWQTGVGWNQLGAYYWSQCHIHTRLSRVMEIHSSSTETPDSSAVRLDSLFVPYVLLL